MIFAVILGFFFGGIHGQQRLQYYITAYKPDGSFNYYECPDASKAEKQSGLFKVALFVITQGCWLNREYTNIKNWIRLERSKFEDPWRKIQIQSNDDYCCGQATEPAAVVEIWNMDIYQCTISGVTQQFFIKNTKITDLTFQKTTPVADITT